MAYPAIVVANELIKLSLSEETPITPMKLQKVLYLANGISYKRKGEKLIDENFEAWDYGPVIENVYHQFKEFRGNSIPQVKDTLISQGYSTVTALSVRVTDEDFAIIKEAWDNSKNLTATTLSSWSHNKNSPWDKAYHSNPKPAFISNKDIQEYFNGFIKD